jgi:hypothetical protein
MRTIFGQRRLSLSYASVRAASVEELPRGPPLVKPDRPSTPLPPEMGNVIRCWVGAIPTLNLNRNLQRNFWPNGYANRCVNIDAQATARSEK